eukprot:COSAG02_NODE_4265_length_5572_cov_3.251416_9_plen_100_part_00
MSTRVSLRALLASDRYVRALLGEIRENATVSPSSSALAVCTWRTTVTSVPLALVTAKLKREQSRAERSQRESRAERTQERAERVPSCGAFSVAQRVEVR